MLAVRLHTILVNGSTVWANTIGLGRYSFVLQYVVVVCVVNTMPLTGMPPPLQWWIVIYTESIFCPLKRRLRTE